MRCITRIACLTALTLIATAQTRPAAFEVVSIRPTPNSFKPPEMDPKVFLITASLTDAITYAYEIHHYQLSGGPVWMSKEYFDIQARSATSATKSEMRAMLQRLLVDHFKLKFHRQTKDTAIYALTVAKSG